MFAGVFKKSPNSELRLTLRGDFPRYGLPQRQRRHRSDGDATEHGFHGNLVVTWRRIRKLEYQVFLARGGFTVA